MNKNNDLLISREQADQIIELRKGLKNCNGFIIGMSEKEYKVKRKIREILGA